MSDKAEVQTRVSCGGQAHSPAQPETAVVTKRQSPTLFAAQSQEATGVAASAVIQERPKANGDQVNNTPAIQGHDSVTDAQAQTSFNVDCAAEHTGPEEIKKELGDGESAQRVEQTLPLPDFTVAIEFRRTYSEGIKKLHEDFITSRNSAQGAVGVQTMSLPNDVAALSAMTPKRAFHKDEGLSRHGILMLSHRGVRLSTFTYNTICRAR